MSETEKNETPATEQAAATSAEETTQEAQGEATEPSAV
jgi:hypothetical protein